MCVYIYIYIYIYADIYDYIYYLLTVVNIAQSKNRLSHPSSLFMIDLFHYVLLIYRGNIAHVDTVNN